MSRRERIVRWVIAGILFGLVIALIRGDALWPTVVIEGALWIALVGGADFLYQHARKRFAKPS